LRSVDGGGRGWSVDGGVREVCVVNVFEGVVEGCHGCCVRA
jgi:hypothetical protein